MRASDREEAKKLYAQVLLGFRIIVVTIIYHYHDNEGTARALIV